MTQASSNKCGFLPNQIYLKRGERKQLVFWTDQNYDNTEAPVPVENTDDKIDIFLQAVNGGVPKPGVKVTQDLNSRWGGGISLNASRPAPIAGYFYSIKASQKLGVGRKQFDQSHKSVYEVDPGCGLRAL